MTRTSPVTEIEGPTETAERPEAPVRSNGNGHRLRERADAGTAVLDRPTRSPHRPTVVLPARRRRVVRRPVVLAAPSPERAPVPLVVLAALGFVLLLALMLRVAAARQLSPQVDEPATILAAHQIVERGLPILPSDTLYLHGSTLSYALAPLVWAGYGDLEDLHKLRMVSVLAGVVAVGFAFWLAYRISGAAWAGVLAAFLLAIDPVSVQWSAHLRMYAALQAATLLTLLLFLDLLVHRRSWRWAVGLVAVFWLAIFTHVGAALILPALAVVAAAVHGRELLRNRRDLLAALAGCAAAPLVLSLLNRLFQPKDYRELTGVPFFSFAGEGFFEIDRLRIPRPFAWRDLYGEGYARDFLPYVVIAFAGLLAGRYLVGRGWAGPDGRGGPPEERDRRVMIGTLIGVYVSAVLVVSFFTWDQTPRYLLHVHPVGYALFAAGLAVVLRRVRLDGGNLLARWRVWLPQTGAAALAVALVLVALADGLADRLRDPFVDTDQVSALQYVAAHRQPGELVIASLPPAPYLALGGDEELVFLAGSELTERVRRYTRLTADGRTVDYWVGVDAITSTAQLCQVLLNRPDAWLILDEERLREDWAYGGEMEETILRMTELVAIAPGGVLVYRRFVPPPGSALESPTCGGHTTLPDVETPAPTDGAHRRGRS
jgi:hypothetical protein